MTIAVVSYITKDPRDDDWASMTADADITTVLTMRTDVSDAALNPPGDALAYGDSDTAPDPLEAYNWVATGTGNRTIMFKIKGGTPGLTYSISAHIQKTDGGLVWRSIPCLVTGL